VSQRYIRSAGVEMAPMREETVLFNPANNQFCVLNKTAAFIWERLAEAHTVEELCAALSASFNNAQGAGVSEDVSAMLARMQLASCVLLSDQ
jgi:hypothetical protein